uniref:Uncharacterized protein n=1 Tax=Elaeophora elaphi TaxID=1147741 RepID=A0A0R3RS25_9BILA
MEVSCDRWNRDSNCQHNNYQFLNDAVRVISILVDYYRFSIMEQSNEEYTTAELRRFTSLLRELNVSNGWHTKTRRKFMQIKACECLKILQCLTAYLFESKNDIEGECLKKVSGGHAASKCRMILNEILAKGAEKE